MLNQDKIQELIDNIQPDTDLNKSRRWVKPLGLDQWTDTSSEWLGKEETLPSLENEAFASYTLQQAILGTIGNFNFWEEEGVIKWSGVDSSDWFKVVRIEKSIWDMNLPKIRKIFWDSAIENMQKFPIHKIYDESWWNRLTELYGHDPLKKRETLLWIILTDLGFQNLPIQNKGCIDYNIILAFRYLGIVIGYKGNIFNLREETELRFECLHVIESILKARPDLSISDLDSLLYRFGRYIRCVEPPEHWDQFFCYRHGCYFY